MSYNLNHKISSVNIINNLNKTYASLTKSMIRLSSGQRINSAADDPAGLVISEQMRTRIASLNQEIENLSHQINRYETASSSVMQMRSTLTEIRSLTVAASNSGVNDKAMTDIYQSEANRMIDNYNNIVSTAQFGSQYLLDGSDGSITSIAAMHHIDLSDIDSAEESLNYIDDTIGRLDNEIGRLGATQKNDLESRLSNLQVTSVNLQAAESRIRDTDMLAEFVTFVKNELLLKSSLALLAHSAIIPQTTLSLIVGR